MGLYVGEIVHIRGDGPESCRPMVVTFDGPADVYHQAINGVEIVPAAADGTPATLVTQLNVPPDGRHPEDTAEASAGWAVGTPGTWHYRLNCPDQPWGGL